MENLTRIFNALSDEIRLRTLKLLEEGELCVCDLVAALDMAQPRVSFHLKILKESGLIRDRKQGKWTYYRIDDSDIFNRFLTLSVFEKIPAESVGKDKGRLKEFRKNMNRCGAGDQAKRTLKRDVPGETK